MKKPRERGATVKHAIEHMDGADLIILAKEMADAFSYLNGPDWAKDLGGFTQTARPALCRAFKVGGMNGQGKASPKVRSPVVAQALLGLVGTRVDNTVGPIPFLPETD